MLKLVICLTKLLTTKFYKVFSQIIEKIIHTELFFRLKQLKKINNIKLGCCKCD